VSVQRGGKYVKGDKGMSHEKNLHIFDKRGGGEGCGLSGVVFWGPAPAVICQASLTVGGHNAYRPSAGSHTIAVTEGVGTRGSVTFVRPSAIESADKDGRTRSDDDQMHRQSPGTAGSGNINRDTERWASGKRRVSKNCDKRCTEIYTVIMKRPI